MKPSPRHFQIALHLLLILWGCGLGPLTYFERLSAHRDVQAGSFVVFGVRVGQTPGLTPEIEAIVYRRSVSVPAQTLRRLQVNQHAPALTHVERSPLKSFLTALTSSELLIPTTNSYALFLIKLLHLNHRHFADTSTFLSPPKKPPSRIFTSLANG